MIEAKEAIIKAKEYLANIYNADMNEMKLEEIEIDDSGEFWNVTISLYTSDSRHIEFRKEYKVIKIRKSNGEVLGMKIRIFK